MQKTILKLLGSLFTIVIFDSCAQLPNNIPANHTCTFTIAEPENYNCFVNHQAAGVPTTKIKLAIHFKTRIINGGSSGPTFIEVDDKTISFDPTVNSFPLTISAEAPVTGLWNTEVIIQGKQCAECANGYGDPLEASGNCVSYTYTTSPLTYQAAKPQWQGGNQYRDNLTTQNVSSPKRIPNVLSTCNNSCRIN